MQKRLIDMALEAGQDATGLQTVREWAADIYASDPIGASDWMVFEHEGRTWRVRLTVEDVRELANGLGV